MAVCAPYPSVNVTPCEAPELTGYVHINPYLPTPPTLGPPVLDLAAAFVAFGLPSEPAPFPRHLLEDELTAASRVALTADVLRLADVSAPAPVPEPALGALLALAVLAARLRRRP
jgi:hypothetical protein